MNDIHINNGYYRLRPAMMDEIPVIWEIILQAKAQMYREGKHQWDENYPTVPILENDVRKGWGYVLVPSPTVQWSLTASLRTMVCGTVSG